MNLHPNVYEHRVQAFKEGAFWAIKHILGSIKELSIETVKAAAEESQAIFEDHEEALSFQTMQARQSEWRP